MSTTAIQLPKLELAEQTPLVRLNRLEAVLNHRNRLFIKRDDLGGIGGGGNKLRKLGYSVAAAKARGCNTLITFGALQSNHARLTAAVAAHCGLHCELILNKRVPRHDDFYERSGNILLEKILGTNVHVLQADEDPLAFAHALEKRLVTEGRSCYVIPFGGSDALGALGYVDCMSELIGQADKAGCKPRHLIHASGSGGTQAGLILGNEINHSNLRIVGVSVLHEKTRLASIVDGIVAEAARVVEWTTPRSAIKTETDDRFVGEGYGIAGPQVRHAVEVLARSEGIFLDPVYTGKAFAYLLHGVREEEIPPNEDIVFLHTGGLPGLFAYTHEFE